MNNTPATTRPARTTRVPNARATEGGVRQEGSLPIYCCNTCQREVVWATSARTGRRYLVDVQHGYKGQRFYIKRAAHTCPTPEPTPTRLTSEQVATLRAQWIAEFTATR